MELPAESDSTDANATYEVSCQQVVNSFRSVSSHLTWRLAFNSTFRPLFSPPANEIKTGMKGQSARLIEPPVIAIRITANANVCGKIARGRPWSCHHLIRKLLHVENCRIYYTSLPRRLKRGYKLRFKRTLNSLSSGDCEIGASGTMRSSPRKKLRYFRLLPNLAQRKLIDLANHRPSFMPYKAVVLA